MLLITLKMLTLEISMIDSVLCLQMDLYVHTNTQDLVWAFAQMYKALAITTVFVLHYHEENRNHHGNICGWKN